MTDLERPPSGLPGVRYGAVVRHADARGSFRELWRASGYPSDGHPGRAGRRRGQPLRPGQPVRSRRPASCAASTTTAASSTAGSWRPVARSWRSSTSGPRPQADGPAVVETRELEADEWVEIPAGVAHGFLALEPLELVYLVTAEFDDSDELGFAWDDPAVGVPWPLPIADTGDGRPILSERDRSNPTLADLVARLRA